MTSPFGAALPNLTRAHLRQELLPITLIFVDWLFLRVLRSGIGTSGPSLNPSPRRELCNSPVRLRRPDVESDSRKTLVPLIRSECLHRLDRGGAQSWQKSC